MTADWRVNHPLVLGKGTVRNGAVMLFHRSRLELLAERGVSRIVFRNQNQAGGVFVQPMDDSRPHFSPDAG